MKSFLRLSLGILLIILGLVFLVTPLTPGAWLLLGIGLQLVGLGILIPKRLRTFLNINLTTKKNEE